MCEVPLRSFQALKSSSRKKIISNHLFYSLWKLSVCSSRWHYSTQTKGNWTTFFMSLSGFVRFPISTIIRTHSFGICRLLLQVRAHQPNLVNLRKPSAAVSLHSAHQSSGLVAACQTVRIAFIGHTKKGSNMNPQSITTTAPNVLRLETLATRLSSSEMRAVKAAAESAGITRSEWLRNAAVAHVDQSNGVSPHSLESTVLAEIMGLRLLVLNLFPAAIPGFAHQSLYQIMAYAESAKHREAAKVLRTSTSVSDPSEKVAI
jgi:hypothetical protein